MEGTSDPGLIYHGRSCDRIPYSLCTDDLIYGSGPGFGRWSEPDPQEMDSGKLQDCIKQCAHYAVYVELPDPGSYLQRGPCDRISSGSFCFCISGFSM